MATMPGTNHCSAEPSARSRGSSGANRPRKTSGWIIAKTTEIGLAPHGLELAVHHVRRCRRRRWTSCLATSLSVSVVGGRCDGGRCRWTAVSRRLRPVRSRKTSSRVGRATSTPRGGHAGRGQVGEQLGRPSSAPSTTRRSSDGAVDLDAGVGHAASSRAAARAESRAAEAEPDPVAQPALEPGRGVVGDHPAVVDHHHPLGQRVGLLEVVGGEHDGGAAARRAAGGPAPGGWPGSAGRGRWTARRGTAARAGGPAPSRCRAGGAGRRRAWRPCGRRPRRGRGRRPARRRAPRVGAGSGRSARPWLTSSSRPSCWCPAPLPWPT